MLCNYSYTSCFFSGVGAVCNLLLNRKIFFKISISRLFKSSICQHVEELEVLALKGFQMVRLSLLKYLLSYSFNIRSTICNEQNLVSARECHCSGFVSFKDVGRCSVTSSTNKLTSLIRSSGKSCAVLLQFAFIGTSWILKAFGFVHLFFWLNLNQLGHNWVISLWYYAESQAKLFCFQFMQKNTYFLLSASNLVWWYAVCIEMFIYCNQVV